MINYNRYELALANIMLQNYLKNENNFYRIDSVPDGQNISLNWFLSIWDDKWWKAEIIYNLMDILAIDKRKNNIELGLCTCDDIVCDDCAFNPAGWDCGYVSRHWLEDESNEVIDNGTELY